MKSLKRSQFEVWANFQVAEKSRIEILNFFVDEYNISPEFIVHFPHLTIYHCRRPMPEVEEVKKSCHLSIDTNYTRFMVLAPGGENPRADLQPSFSKVGIRIHASAVLRDKILEYRKQFYLHETPVVLGIRKPSTKRRNAFGARNFQPHISLLNAGSGIQFNLNEVGERFRDAIPEIHFDRFIISKKKNF